MGITAGLRAVSEQNVVWNYGLCGMGGNMGRYSERFWMRIQEYEKDEMRDRISHSTSYHSFFQGYSEHRVRRRNGRGYCIERIYTADYCKYRESDALWRFRKAYYLMVLAAAVTALIAGGVSCSELNRTKIIGIAQMLEWIPLAYLAYSMFFQLEAPRRMTIGDYKASSVKLKWGALIASVYLAGVFLVMAAVKLSGGSVFEGCDRTALLGEAVGAGLCFLIFRMEHRREIEWVKNGIQVPADANEIW